MNEYTTEMESFIGNSTKSTMKYHEEYQDDPYITIFPEDKLDSDDINF